MMNKCAEIHLWTIKHASLPFDQPALRLSSMKTFFHNTQIDPQDSVPANQEQVHSPPHQRQTILCQECHLNDKYQRDKQPEFKILPN